jgi:hypothetical protein
MQTTSIRQEQDGKSSVALHPEFEQHVLDASRNLLLPYEFHPKKTNLAGNTANTSV